MAKVYEDKKQALRDEKAKREKDIEDGIVNLPNKRREQRQANRQSAENKHDLHHPSRRGSRDTKPGASIHDASVSGSREMEHEPKAEKVEDRLIEQGYMYK